MLLKIIHSRTLLNKFTRIFIAILFDCIKVDTVYNIIMTTMLCYCYQQLWIAGVNK